MDGQFQARIELPDGSDAWDDWFSWQEEGVDWRRKADGTKGKTREAAKGEAEVASEALVDVARPEAASPPAAAAASCASAPPPPREWAWPYEGESIEVVRVRVRVRVRVSPGSPWLTLTLTLILTRWRWRWATRRPPRGCRRGCCRCSSMAWLG